MVSLVLVPLEPTTEERTESLRAHRWFLDRAKGGGIELTAAGYLKPADVEAASRVLPAMSDWIGKNNRESLAAPLLDFRQTLQSMGLLRKFKGTLLPTRAGAAAQKDPEKLWDLLAGKLLGAGKGFDRDATLLLLAYAATSLEADLPLARVAEALGHLGWRHRDGTPLDGYELSRLPPSTSSPTSPSAPPRAGTGDRSVQPLPRSPGQPFSAARTDEAASLLCMSGVTHAGPQDHRAARDPGAPPRTVAQHDRRSVPGPAAS